MAPRLPTILSMYFWWGINTVRRMGDWESRLTVDYFVDPDAWEMSLRSLELILKACYQRESEFWEQEAVQVPMESTHPTHSCSVVESEGFVNLQSCLECCLRFGSGHRKRSEDFGGCQEKKEATLALRLQKSSAGLGTPSLPTQESVSLKALEFLQTVGRGRETPLCWLHPLLHIELHWKTHTDQHWLQTPKCWRSYLQVNQPSCSSLMQELQNPAGPEAAGLLGGRYQWRGTKVYAPRRHAQCPVFL